MEKSKLSTIIDTVLLSTSITLVCYCWLNKWLKNKLVSILISGIISFLVSKFTYDLYKKQINKHNLKKSEQVFAENCIKYFAMHPKNCIVFFHNILSGKIYKNCIITQKEIFYINYFDEIITTKQISELLEISNKNHNLPLYIFAQNVTDKAKIAATENNMTIKDRNDLFMIMKAKNKYPIENNNQPKKRKITIKMQLNNLIDRKKATHQLFYGILLISLSFIIPYSFYYIVFGTFFIIIGVLSIFIKHKTLS